MKLIIKTTTENGNKTRLYNIWSKIKQRCSNSKNKDYKYYGGRGITVCPEWTESYIVFRDWSLSNGYSEGLEIDRINNDGNYEPSNCQWITHEENSKNRRNPKRKKITIEIINKVKIKYNSGYYTQQLIAKELNISQISVSRIINNTQWKNDE